MNKMPISLMSWLKDETMTNVINGSTSNLPLTHNKSFYFKYFITSHHFYNILNSSNTDNGSKIEAASKSPGKFSFFVDI